MSEVVVTYKKEQISVPQEVADFLERDRKRAQAEHKRDQRHLDGNPIDVALSHCPSPDRVTEDTVLRNIQLESLRKAIAELDERDQRLIDLRYDDELSMEEIGKLLNVSKMTVSKRLKKLHQKLRDSVT